MKITKENHIEQSPVITKVLVTFLSGYTGHPCMVSGHAIRTALKMKVPCSFGLFTTEKSLNGQQKPGSYEELMEIRVNNYVPPFEQRMICAANKQPFTIPVYYPVAVTFDMIGDHAERLANTGEFHLGGRRGTDHGRCRVIDTAVIDLAGIKLPEKAEWATLVTPRIITANWPVFFESRKVRSKKQLVIRFPRVTEYRVYPLGTIFKLKKGILPVEFLVKEKKLPVMGHGPLSELGFGEMHFWDRN